MTALFEVGRIVVTTGADEMVKRHLGEADGRGLAWLLDTVDKRHAAGDYGLVCVEDTEANNAAAAAGGRVMSAYEVPCPGCDDIRRLIWVITDPGHTRTTVLLPEEY